MLPFPVPYTALPMLIFIVFSAITVARRALQRGQSRCLCACFLSRSAPSQVA